MAPSIQLKDSWIEAAHEGEEPLLLSRFRTRLKTAACKATCDFCQSCSGGCSTSSLRGMHQCLTNSLSLSFPGSTIAMADEADMRNELADLQTRADQIADEVQSRTCEQPQSCRLIGWSSLVLCLCAIYICWILIQKRERMTECSHAQYDKPDSRNSTSP